MLGGVRGREPKPSLTGGYLACLVPTGGVGSGRSVRFVANAGCCTGLENLLILYTVPSVPSSEADSSFRGLW